MKWRRPARRAWLATVLAMAASAQAAESAEPSVCFGRPGNGRIEHSVQLPVEGANFSAYSTLAATLGRTYVHTTVAQVILDAYAASARTRPDTRYVYGETGWASGGRFRPHRTHQNGLSVDFFVPVLDAQGRSVPLPTSVSNRWGYDIEFDAQGRYGEYRIDFAALAEHLYQLQMAAKAHGTGMALVIFDAPYLPQLFATPRGAFLREQLPFMKGKPWIRHDEHYHVDFALACRPL